MRFLCLPLLDDLNLLRIRKSFLEYFHVWAPLRVLLIILNHISILFLFAFGWLVLFSLCFAVFVVHLCTPVDEALLRVGRKQIEELSCDSAIKRVCESHLALVLNLALVLLALDLLDLPKGIKFTEDLRWHRSLSLLARHTQHIIRFFVSDFGNVRKAHHLEPDRCFSIEFAFLYSVLHASFVRVFKNFALCHVLHKVLVIIYVPHHIIKILLWERKNFGGFKSNWLLLTWSRQVREKASWIFWGITRLSKQEWPGLYSQNCNVIEWFI